MKLAEVVAGFLAEQVRHVFTVSGGADLHLIHGINKRSDIKFICPQNEQGAGFMADAYARLTGMGCALVTSGPGAQNLVTPIATSYYDSIPCLYLTGQQTRERMAMEGVRQYGFQATPIVPMVRDITKHAVTVMEPQKILYELQKAVHVAKSGRPGPVVVDIPDDLQRAEVDPAKLEQFWPENNASIYEQFELAETAAEVFEEMESAERPVLIFGSGVRLAGAEKEASVLAQTIGIPVAVTWGVRDFTIPNVGGFGTHGTKLANVTVQNADYILCIGSRLDTKATSSPASLFAPNAKLVMVDIDSAEVAKMPKVGRALHRGVVADAKDFMAQMIRIASKLDVALWNRTVDAWRVRYPIFQAEYEQDQGINPYVLVRELSNQLRPDDIIVSDTGCAMGWMMQGYPFKGERFIHAFNNTPMGYGLPAAIGAAFASGKRVVLVTGDGGFSVNITELATVERHALPIKVILFNNRGHAMCRQTQRQWLGGEYPSTSYEGGLACPDFSSVASAYGFHSSRLSLKSDISRRLEETLSGERMALLEVHIDQEYGLANQVKFGESLAIPEAA